MSPKQIKLSALGIGLLALFSWVVLTQGPLAPVKVTLEKVHVGSLASTVFGIGTLQARYSYNLAPTFTSRVKSVLVDQGDRVVAGQVLAEMDPVDLDEKLVASQRMVEKTASSILAAEAQEREARSRFETSSSTFTRYQDLRVQGFVSQEMFAAKQYEKNAAAAALAAASANVAAARSEHDRGQADLRGIGKTRAQMRLISPVNGVVVARMAEAGSTVGGGQLVLRVIDENSLWIETRIAQQQAGQIRVGQDAEVVLRSRPHQPLPGKVARIDRVSDVVTEERIVNISVNVPGASIGEYAEVTIRLPELGNVRSVPAAAVKRIDKQDGVWLLADKELQFRAVKVGMTTLEGRTQILEGLADDDAVVVYSQQPLRAGVNVKVVTELVKS
ncbi:MAG: efflux RND transporter periplasmic adaptor subunit [Sideroxyarcus sp.]|nr:efflux RND transporter periplasmic adaptor subunit [Sideroxyarcus sp.]